ESYEFLEEYDKDNSGKISIHELSEKAYREKLANNLSNKEKEGGKG
ncbi:4429_t:CDS:1, partial [Gigaspora rosea]